MSKLKENLHEFKHIYIKNAPGHFILRDHYLKVFDEFALKKGYKTHDKYSLIVFSKEIRNSLQTGINVGYVAIETLDNVNATHFKQKMGISARIIRNVEWFDLNLSDNCIDAVSFVTNYRKRVPKIPGRKRTQYLHEVIPFQTATTDEGLDEYLSWMSKVNFDEESFSSNKNLFYQNHMLISLLAELKKDLNEFKIETRKNFLELKQIILDQNSKK